MLRLFLASWHPNLHPLFKGYLRSTNLVYLQAGQGQSQSLVKAMDGYGLGVAATFNESIKSKVVQTKNLVMRIDRVDQDSPVWTRIVDHYM